MVPRLTALLFAAVVFCSACGSSASDVSGPAHLVESPERFGMNIQAAGTATIPDASLLDGELTVSYEYAATDGTGEQRAGSMNLTVAEDRTATGRWRTVADNGTVYNGPLSFDFADDGTAIGTYQFDGITYDITIHLLD